MMTNWRGFKTERTPTQLSSAHMVPVLFLGMIGALFAAACGPDPDDDPASIQGSGEVWTLSPQLTVEIGGAAAEGPNALYRVRGARTLPDGRILIWQSDGELLLFSKIGVFERYLGREGEGPGEFRNAAGVSLVRETGNLKIMDPAVLRITTLTPEGRLVETARIEPTGLLWARTWHGQPDGSFLGLVSESIRRMFDHRIADQADPREESRLGLMGDSVHVVRVTEKGTEVIHTREAALRFRTRSGNVTMNRGIPFGPRLLAAIGPGLFAQGFNDQGVFLVLSITGDTLGTVKSVTPKRPIPPAVWNEAEEKFLAATHFEPLLGDQQEDVFERILGGTPKPKHFPLVGRAEFDQEGNLWLRRFNHESPGPSIWEVHSAEGEFRAQATIPRGMDLLEIGPEHILGLLQDSLDVERVARFELIRDGDTPDQGRNQD